MRLGIVGFEDEFHVEFFRRIIRYYGANATSFRDASLYQISRMAEIRTVTTLVKKRDEIRASIRMYESKIAQARSDLSHVTAVLRLFEASGRGQDLARYVDSYRLFKRGEPWAICAAALASGPLSTKELALELMKAKDMDLKDAVLAKTMGTGSFIRCGCRNSGAA